MEKHAAGAAADPAPRRSFGAAWNAFWFKPADPTPLGVIRILCGAVAFYSFLAYTLDLQALLGEHAWLDLEARRILIRESPTPHLDWPRYYKEYNLTLPYEPVGPPQTKRERDYLREYVAKWGVPPPAPYPKSFPEGAYYEEYKARWGADPRSVYSMGESSWSIWFHVTDPDAMMAIQVVTVLVSFLFLIGFCTRLTGALTWLAALSYMHRTPTSLFGADTMIAVMLLYLNLGPCSAVLSVDRWLSRWWSKRREQGSAPAADAAALSPPSASVSANLALRLMQVHLCFVYASAGLSKLLGLTWWTGTAVWSTMANPEFAPMQSGWYMEALRFLGQHRWLFELTMNTAGLFTLFFEISYAYLIWRPRTRWLMLWMAFVLHGFIGVFMGLKTFSLMMLTMNLAFVPPETMRRFGQWCERRARAVWSWVAGKGGAQAVPSGRAGGA
jgi:hypothetical protein